MTMIKLADGTVIITDGKNKKNKKSKKKKAKVVDNDEAGFDYEKIGRSFT
tara:strand:+ start:171 stop:320 length:150 start_codon:yes stop_codon:yes gene_type:complete